MAKKLNYLDTGQPFSADEMNNELAKKYGKQKEKKEKSFVWTFFRPVVIVAASIAVVSILIYNVYSYVMENYFDAVDPTSRELIQITIEPNTSLTEISEILEENGIVKDKTVFKLYTDFSDMASKLRAGTYVFTQNMSFDDIIYTLSKGRNETEQIRITFREGLGIGDFGAELVEKGILKNTTRYEEICRTGESFTQYTLVQDVLEKDAQSAEPRRYILEGYLFPETYDYYSNASEEDIIQKQIEQFQKVFTEDYYARAAELGLSVDDVVILASIIEKEAKTADFAKVSAVFHNRMNDGMRLDSDATVSYYLGTNRLMLTEEERAVDTRYNTLRYEGLPPGPIGNPGKAAIEAVLYPDEEYLGEYYYFTLMDVETGELVFTKTLDEHEAEVAKYQHLYQEADDAAAAAAAAGQGNE